VQLLWRQAALLWRAKGYTLTQATDAMEARFGTNNGYGRSRVSILIKTQCEPCPPEAAEFILSNDEKTGLKVLNAKRWAKFQRELTAILEGDSKAPSAPVDLRELAKEAASLVTDTVRGWLDTAGGTLQAFATQGGALLSGLASKLDSAGSQLDSQNAKLDSTANKLDDVNAKLDGNGVKLDKLNAKLDSNGAKLDTLYKTANNTEALAEVIRAKMDTSEQRRRREHLRIMGAILGVGLLLTCVSRSGTAPTAPAQNVTVNVGQGATDVAGRRVPGRQGDATDPESRSAEQIAGDMGERHPTSEPVMMPHQPFPWQRVAPCPGSSKVMYGGCWYVTEEKAPCPSDQFQEGQKCYVPIHAKEPKSSSETAQPLNPEHH